MQDSVRIEDYLQYLECVKNSTSEKASTARNLYAAKKLEYESKFLPKLFNWQYENSYHGDRSWMGSWYFYSPEIKTFSDEIARCNYLKKIGMNYISLDNTSISKSCFYRWCAENSIPY